MLRPQVILICLRDHLAGKPALPPEGSAIIWNAFASLAVARSWNDHGPNPISFADIEAYSRLMRLPLEPHHVSLIRDMDQVWVRSIQAEVTPGTKPKGKPVPLTAATFDALFGVGGK